LQIFNIHSIEKSLDSFRRSFHTLNKKLSIFRDEFDKELASNIVEAYSFLNHLLKRKIDLFSPAGRHSLLELNHLVLCGSNASKRSEYYQHVLETRKKFNNTIIPIKQWVIGHKNMPDPYTLASGYYCRSLSQPQLFIEGNHRTANIVLNYLLLSRGEPPLILSDTNAFDYLEISGDIKFSFKRNFIEKLRLLIGLQNKFKYYLRGYVSEKYLTDILETN